MASQHIFGLPKQSQMALQIFFLFMPWSALCGSYHFIRRAQSRSRESESNEGHVRPHNQGRCVEIPRVHPILVQISPNASRSGDTTKRAHKEGGPFPLGLLTTGSCIPTAEIFMLWSAHLGVLWETGCICLPQTADIRTELSTHWEGNVSNSVQNTEVQRVHTGKANSA